MNATKNKAKVNTASVTTINLQDKDIQKKMLEAERAREQRLRKACRVAKAMVAVDLAHAKATSTEDPLDKLRVTQKRSALKESMVLGGRCATKDEFESALEQAVEECDWILGGSF